MSDRKVTMARFCEDDPEDDDHLFGVFNEDGRDDYCQTCQGTGIGQHGDPDTSKCHSCRGTGRSRVHDQELIDRRNEEIRDMKIDDELLREGK